MSVPSNPSLVSFDNTEIAFAYKSDKELKSARFLFSLMRYNTLVNWGVKLTPWAINAGLPVKGLVKNTIFKQFVGGETLEETAPVVAKLAKHGVQVILDYGVEGGGKGEEGYEAACRQFIKVVQYAATQQNIPYISIKITGISKTSLLEKLDRSVGALPGTLMKRYQQALQALKPSEQEEWAAVVKRLDRICAKAASLEVGVLVDAEETWIQDPVDVITTLMMEKYNKGKVIVYNTFQLYRTDRFKFLKDSHEAAIQRDFILGAKLVRGAYMEQERDRADELEYDSPIQPDKQSTDWDYNESIRFCIDNIDRIALMVASHNEFSNMYAAQLADERGIERGHKHLHFSQLYGMSDTITFNLAQGGFFVSKYLPFGPIKEVVPYLMRRAQENSSMADQTGKELELLIKELNRRKGFGMDEDEDD